MRENDPVGLWWLLGLVSNRSGRPPPSDRQPSPSYVLMDEPVGLFRTLAGLSWFGVEKGTRSGSTAQGQRRRRAAQLPSDRRGGRPAVRLTQDRVPLGQGGQAAVHGDLGWASPLPGGRNPGAGR